MSADDAGTETGPNTNRLEAFSDGVFAVAITLLIFNLHVDAHSAHLARDLRAEWPHYVAYVLSFIVIGIIWAQHHSIFTQIARCDHPFLLINVTFLMWVSFLPFPVSVLGDHLGRSGEDVAMTLYAGTFLVGTIPFNLLWRYAAHNGRLLHTRVDLRLLAAISRSYLLGPLLYAIDLALSLVNTQASFAFFCLTALFYAIAPIPVVNRTRVMRLLTGGGRRETARPG